ncbi:MAG: hypothetical protein JXA10_13615 [Anaerolineae bacterium]|nr:hypothetical protein [Anaerolineae bacterium]
MSQRFEFPPTPDIAGAVRDRIEPENRGFRPLVMRVVQPVAILLLVMILIVLLVPDLRARAFDWLHIGAIRIVNESPVATHTPELEFDVTPIGSILDWEYEITLADARDRVDFPIPDVPELGEPDAMFFYQLEEPMVILVWETTTQAPISLHLIGSANRAFKYSAEDEIRTEVNGHPALWLSSPHLYEIMPQTDSVIQRFVNGRVLIWEADGITYRLEGDLTLAAARQLAESIE